MVYSKFDDVYGWTAYFDSDFVGMGVYQRRLSWIPSISITDEFIILTELWKRLGKHRAIIITFNAFLRQGVINVF